jgi:hypothetical protein
VCLYFVVRKDLNLSVVVWYQRGEYVLARRVQVRHLLVSMLCRVRSDVTAVGEFLQWGFLLGLRYQILRGLRPPVSLNMDLCKLLLFGMVVAVHGGTYGPQTRVLSASKSDGEQIPIGAGASYDTLTIDCR